MKQFKVGSKNTVYNVFADSEVEAVNKVKEVEAKVGDAIMVYSFETIKENGSKGSISVRASSEQEAKVEAEKLLKREVNTFGVKMKLGKLFNSYKVGDSKVNDAYNIKPGAIFKSGNEERFNGKVINRYLKVMKLMKINGEDVALINSIIKNGDQYERSYSDEWSIDHLKRYLSLGKYRPVNSLYDSKIQDYSIFEYVMANDVAKHHLVKKLIKKSPLKYEVTMYNGVTVRLKFIPMHGNWAYEIDNTVYAHDGDEWLISDLEKEASKKTQGGTK